MTEPLIKLPSVIAQEMAQEMAQKMAQKMAQEMAQEMAREMAAERLIQMQDEIAVREAQIASKDLEIQRLRELVSQLSSEKHLLS